DAPGAVFLTVTRSPSETILGVAGSFTVKPTPPAAAPTATVSFRAGLVRAAADGLRSIAGTAAGPLRLDAELTLDPTGAPGFEGVRLAVAAAPLEPLATVPSVRAELIGLRSAGKRIPSVVLDPRKLDQQAIQLLQALIQSRLKDLA